MKIVRHTKLAGQNNGATKLLMSKEVAMLAKVCPPYGGQYVRAGRLEEICSNRRRIPYEPDAMNECKLEKLPFETASPKTVSCVKCDYRRTNGSPKGCVCTRKAVV